MMANEGAELAAVTEAAEAAEANAEQALLLTGCPRCGVVNPVARREHGIGTFFRATLAALGGAVVGLIVARTMSAHSVTAPVLLSGGVGAAIAVFVRRRQCAALRDQVMLFPDRAPSDDLSMI
jgi:hypothetical protein